jgi:hypothetical protein
MTITTLLLQWSKERYLTGPDPGAEVGFGLAPCCFDDTSEKDSQGSFQPGIEESIM